MDRSRLSLEEFMDRYGGCCKSDHPSICVFGYGSLLWKPESDYNSYQIGYIENFARRFNQGNETQRGTSDKMARVANIEEQKGAQTWGIAYQFQGQEEVTKALHKLYYREVVGGDYDVIKTTFHPRSPDSPYRNVPLPHPSSSPSKIACHIESSLQIGSSYSTIKASHSTYCLHHSDNQTSFDDYTDSSYPYQSLACEETAIHSYYNRVPSFTPGIAQDSSLIKLVICDNSFRILNHRLHQSSTESNINSELYANQNKTQHLLSSDDVRKKVNTENDEFKQLPFNTFNNTAVDVLVFTAKESNRLYLGSDSIHNMANQIMDAEGIVGPNLEYILKTSEFVKKYIPEDDDELLFELDSALRDRIAMKEMVTEMSENELGSSRIIG